MLSIDSPAIPIIHDEPALSPVRLSGREAVNGLFEYELLAKTPDAMNLGTSQGIDLNLDDFIGREIACSIQPDGSGHFIRGVVGMSVDRVGSDDYPTVA
jgi:type VI secretion system secreted protein VgrG